MKLLLIPSNPSHAATLMPVAEELHHRGHTPIFLSRDSLIEEEYRVEPLLNNRDMPFVRYEAFYETDVGRFFPQIKGYVNFSSIFKSFLVHVGADALVVCNDDSALFDRIAVDYFISSGKNAFLIQESVRPAIRKLSFSDRWREQGLKEIIRIFLMNRAYKLKMGPFFSKGYAHSPGIRIFAAGDNFRQKLIDEGIEKSRIIVTGQPRLDRKACVTTKRKSDDRIIKEKVVLYCSQPVKCSQKTQDRLFVQLVEVIDNMEDVKLIVKLHPRDFPEAYWYQLLGKGKGKSLLQVTKEKSLAECFNMSDVFLTIASTTCLEAMDYGLPVGLIAYLPIEWYLPYSNLNAVLSIESEKELKESIERLLFNEPLRKQLCEGANEVLFKELYLRDSNSVNRICDNIERILMTGHHVSR